MRYSQIKLHLNRAHVQLIFFHSRISSMKDTACWFTFWHKLLTLLWTGSSLWTGYFEQHWCREQGPGRGKDKNRGFGMGSDLIGMIRARVTEFRILVIGNSYSGCSKPKFQSQPRLLCLPLFSTQSANPAHCTFKTSPNSDHFHYPHLNHPGPGHQHLLLG